MSAILVILLALLPGALTGRQTQPCGQATSLGVRNAHALAYDQEQRAVVLFGGADERHVLGDLWVWEDGSWHCLANEGPPPRTFPVLVHDGERLILFGGNRVLFGTESDTGTFLNDMWAWSGGGWQRIDTPVPSARAEASVAYDPHRRRVVLFGGHRTEHDERIRLRDTWEWDGQRWQQVSSSGPPPRNGTAMAYDAERRRTVLFGGSGAPGDTWEWDGSRWEQTPGPRVPGRFNTTMAYDAARRIIVRFGGWTGADRVGDTWTYDGREWTLTGAGGPAGRNHAAMAYDPRREVVVLYGGHDGDNVFGDTWEWDGGGWLRRTMQPPLRRVDNGH